MSNKHFPSIVDYWCKIAALLYSDTYNLPAWQREYYKLREREISDRAMQLIDISAVLPAGVSISSASRKL